VRLVVWEGKRTDFFVAIDFVVSNRFLCLFEAAEGLTYCNLTDDILTVEYP
jgi:hypothetical protein